MRSDDIPKFEVGKVYYATWGDKKRYYLCVKRNERTQYVSFNPILGGRRMGNSDARRIKIGFKWDKSGGKYSEEISIGFGGDGAWRNHYVIRADQKADISYRE